MNNDTLLTTPITQDAKQIIDSINLRSNEIQHMLINAPLPRKASEAIAKAMAFLGVGITLVAIPTAIYEQSVDPLIYAGAGVAIAIVSAISLLLLDTRSASEALIKKQWEQLFASMEKGDSTSIIALCDGLLKKKNTQPTDFHNNIKHTSTETVDRFLQKTLFAGYLLKALQAIDSDNTQEARSYAHLALASFVLSGFPKEAADCAHAIVNKPGRVINRLNQCGCPKNIIDLDAFTSTMADPLGDNHLHDFTPNLTM